MKRLFLLKQIVTLGYLQGNASARGLNKYLDFIITIFYGTIYWLNQRVMESADLISISWPLEHVVSCKRQRNELERQSEDST